MVLIISVILIHCIYFSNALLGEQVIQPEEGSLRFVVGIKKFNFGNPQSETDHIGTGALISKKDVLTAASILDGLENQRFELVMGSIDLRTAVVSRPYWFLTYDQWSALNEVQVLLDSRDCGLVRLIGEISFEIADPIPISPVGADFLVGRGVLIAGWGQRINGTIDRNMKAASLTIYQNSVCLTKLEELLGQRKSIPSNYICSFADPFVLTTPGYIGAPIMFMGNLVAIHKSICPPLQDGYHEHQFNVHLVVKDFQDFIYELLTVE